LLPNFGAEKMNTIDSKGQKKRGSKSKCRIKKIKYRRNHVGEARNNLKEGIKSLKDQEDRNKIYEEQAEFTKIKPFAHGVEAPIKPSYSAVDDDAQVQENAMAFRDLNGNVLPRRKFRL
jgi:hypothetical protein